jgi:hypothetical protein
VGARLALLFLMSWAQNYVADAMVGASSLFTVIAGVSIISPDVRTQIANALGDGPVSQISAMASSALDYVHVLTRVAGDYRLENGPLVGFGILAVVLTVMMTRS